MVLVSNQTYFTLRRDRVTGLGTRTTGELFLNASPDVTREFRCYTLEDAPILAATPDFERYGYGSILPPFLTAEKKTGSTAIPAGLYRLAVTYSERFKRPLPLIIDVPGFSGIRMHGGNTEADTLGCVLLGTRQSIDGSISRCSPAVSAIIREIRYAERAGSVWLRIFNPEGKR